MIIKQATHKSGEGTVSLREADLGWIVTVHKEALPPHYSQEFGDFIDAGHDFDRLAGNPVEPIHIKVEFSTSSLFDGWQADEEYDDAEIDEKASCAAYANQLEGAIREVYPGAEIEIVHGINDRYSIDGRTDVDDVGYVMHIAGEVYEAFDWVR